MKIAICTVSAKGLEIAHNVVVAVKLRKLISQIPKPKRLGSSAVILNISRRARWGMKLSVIAQNVLCCHFVTCLNTFQLRVKQFEVEEMMDSGVARNKCFNERLDLI